MNYSLRRVCRIVRLSPAVVASLVGAGVIAPARGPQGALEFTFRDLAVLRGLAQARPAALKRGAPPAGAGWSRVERGPSCSNPTAPRGTRKAASC